MSICSHGGPTCTFAAHEGPHVHLQPRRAHMYICSPGGPTSPYLEGAGLKKTCFASFWSRLLSFLEPPSPNDRIFCPKMAKKSHFWA